MIWFVVLTVVVLLMSRLMVGLYTSQTYTCPGCGASHPDRHADECPWRR
jgi:hypothetical protein